MKRWAAAFLVLAATPAAAEPRCIELRSEVARYYRCLNEDLRRLVPPSAARRDPELPYSAATTPPSRVGGFSFAGTRQMLGRNFGVSNQPDRPPPVNARPSPLFQGR